MSTEPDADWLELVRPARPDPDAQATAPQRAALAGDPALRAELARRTLFDDAAAAVVQDVPIPAGLVERLARGPLAKPAPRPRGKLLSRRAAGIAAACLLLLAGVWWRFGPDRSWTPERVAAAAVALHHGPALPDRPADWRDWLPQRFDADALERAGEVEFLGRRAVALQLRRGGETATLVLLRPHAFPWGFDFDAYVAAGPGDPEVAFLREGGMVCVAVARDLAPFERRAAAL